MLKFRLKKEDVIARLNKILGNQAKRRVVMLHNGRVGSAVLGKMLNHHPMIYWDGELLKRPRVQQITQRSGAPIDPLQRISERTYLCRNVYGFEIKHQHIDYLKFDLSSFLTSLEELDFTHFILLDRRNEVRRAISRFMLKETGRAHVKTGTEYHPPMIRIDPTDFLEHMELRAEHYQAFHHAMVSRNCLKLIYEDDVQNDPTVAYAKCCRFLQCEPQSNPRIEFRRTNLFPLSQIVTNYDDLVIALTGTRYAEMLD